MTRLWRDRSGAAAAEMALVLPLLLILMMGPLELGNYFLNEHTLLKGLRDGAVYAARQDIGNFNCTSATPLTAAFKTSVKNIVGGGQLTTGAERLPGWSTVTFDVTYACFTATSGTTLSGIYSANKGQVPVVTVTASLPYHMVLSSMGFDATALTLSGDQQAVVTGI